MMTNPTNHPQTTAVMIAAQTVTATVALQTVKVQAVLVKVTVVKHHHHHLHRLILIMADQEKGEEKSLKDSEEFNIILANSGLGFTADFIAISTN